MPNAVELRGVLEALRRARESGSPVGHPSEEYARVALRRWSSFANRNLDPADREGRIRDLAKGLIAHFERDPKLVGPERVEYQYVARLIADYLSPDDTSPGWLPSRRRQSSDRADP